MQKLLSITVLIALTIFALSCSKAEDETVDTTAPMKTGEIIDNYVETLSTATDRAKTAAGLVDTHNDTEMRALEAIDAN